MAMAKMIPPTAATISAMVVVTMKMMDDDDGLDYNNIILTWQC